MSNSNTGIMFAELVYKKNLLEHKDNNERYIAKAYELKKNNKLNSDWIGDTYNTLSSYNLINDPLFNNLINDCKIEVKEFAKEYGINNRVPACSEAWINIAEPGNFQEYHVHTLNHFSLVYYVKIPINCGKIIFRSHEADKDMFPLPLPEQFVMPNFKTYHIQPQEGDVIVFRSNLAHMVEKNKSNENRISIAMNFRMT